MSIQAAIVGGTGYTGIELIRLLSAHPNVTLSVLTSRGQAGTPACELFPGLRGITDIVYEDLVDATWEKIKSCDVVFFATPHGVAMQHAPSLIEAGVKVIDLGADFRLQSLAAFEQWYNQSHTCPELLKEAVYGLPEMTRNQLKTARLVGNPGCYPTTALLGLKPLVDLQNQNQSSLIDGSIIIDAKSGVSGAGRQASIGHGYAENADNFKAYGVTGHRHLPEIEQGIELLMQSQFEHTVRFLPHLVPMIRGMFTTIHIPLSSEANQIDLHAIYSKSYAQETFVDVLPKGQYPDTRSVRASNRLRIAVYQQPDMATVLVVQDNLVKGASGQAIQSMNVLFGFEESLGLMQAPITP